MTNQTDNDLDAIRQRQDDRHLDDKYGPAELRNRHQEAVQQFESQRNHDLIAELLDVRECLAKGSLDYDAAAGILITYLDHILALAKNK